MSIFCPQYQKPSLILEQEKVVRQELVKVKSSRDGDVECKPSWQEKRSSLVEDAVNIFPSIYGKEQSIRCHSSSTAVWIFVLKKYLQMQISQVRR